MAAIAHEIRYALRLIRRNKGFSLAVLLSTALGVGATASIFSLIDAFLLRPLPIPATGRVVRVTSLTQSNPVGRLSYPEIDDIESRAQSFEGVATAKIAPFGFARSRDEQPRVSIGFLVNGDFFRTLGVTPSLGRGFTAAEDRIAGRSAIAVISDAMWRREFGGRGDVIGQTLRLNGIEFTIVGVTPPSFAGVNQFVQPALYVPRAMIREATGAAADALTDRTARSVEGFA